MKASFAAYHLPAIISEEHIVFLHLSIT